METKRVRQTGPSQMRGRQAQSHVEVSEGSSSASGSNSSLKELESRFEKLEQVLSDMTLDLGLTRDSVQSLRNRKMNIQVFSIVAGSEACNARCPFCISKMTPPNGMTLKEPGVNWRNFRKACKFAQRHSINTAMLTGKGEPTLFPNQISRFMKILADYEFPIIELQTNGIPIAEAKNVTEDHLQDWYAAGLTTIAISVVHYDPEKNRQIYLPHQSKYIDLPFLIQRLHDVGFSVRLSTVMADGFLDSGAELEAMIDFAKENKVEQLSARPVIKPQSSRDQEAYGWTNQHHLKDEQLADIDAFLQRAGVPLMTLPYGAVVYDIKGQNLCMTNCLTIDSASQDLRQIIFFPDGHLRYDWQYEGAILF